MAISRQHALDCSTTVDPYSSNENQDSQDSIVESPVQEPRKLQPARKPSKTMPLNGFSINAGLIQACLDDVVSSRALLSQKSSDKVPKFLKELDQWEQMTRAGSLCEELIPMLQAQAPKYARKSSFAKNKIDKSPPQQTRKQESEIGSSATLQASKFLPEHFESKVVTLPRSQVQGTLRFHTVEVSLSQNGVVQTHLELCSQTNLIFLPQSAIELLLAEHLLDIGGIEDKNVLEDGILCLNETKLREALTQNFNELCQRHRRRLANRSSIHVVSIEEENVNFEVNVSFPRVEFIPSDANGQKLERAVDLNELSLIIQAQEADKLFQQATAYFDSKIMQQQPAEDSAEPATNSHLVTAKVLLNQTENLILQKKWLAFDLTLEDEWLATYECSQQETYALVAEASRLYPSPTMTHLLEIFAKRCKFSHSELLKKWVICLDKDFVATSQQPGEEEKLQAVVESLTEDAKSGALTRGRSSNLYCHLTFKKPSTGIFTESFSMQKQCHGISDVDSFSSSDSEEEHKVANPAKNSAEQTLTLQMRPPEVTVTNYSVENKYRIVSDLLQEVDSDSDDFDSPSVPAKRHCYNYYCFEKAQKAEQRTAWVKAAVEARIR